MRLGTVVKQNILLNSNKVQGFYDISRKHLQVKSHLYIKGVELFSNYIILNCIKEKARCYTNSTNQAKEYIV